MRCLSFDPILVYSSIISSTGIRYTWYVRKAFESSDGVLSSVAEGLGYDGMRQVSFTERGVVLLLFLLFGIRIGVSVGLWLLFFLPIMLHDHQKYDEHVKLNKKNAITFFLVKVKCCCYVRSTTQGIVYPK